MVRRGSIGDSSGNDFGGVGGGSDTDAGTGSTGDDSDNDFGGGSDRDDSGGVSGGGSEDSGGFGGGADDSDSGFGGGGDDDDDDNDYDPNPSDRETGGDDDRDLDDITGGRDYGEEQPQSTGDQQSRNQGGAGGTDPEPDDPGTTDSVEGSDRSDGQLPSDPARTADRGLQTYLQDTSADTTPGIEAREDQLGQRAAELEAEAVSQLPVETDETPFEANELIRVTREDQRLQTELTQAGVRVFQARAAQEAGLEPGQDFASVENAVRAEETDQGVALELTDLGRRQAALRQTLEQNPALDEEDIVVTSAEEGDLDVRLTPSGEDKLTETTTRTETITIGTTGDRGPGNAGSDIITGEEPTPLSQSDPTLARAARQAEREDLRTAEFAEGEEGEVVRASEQFSLDSFVNTPFRSLQTAGRRREQAVINTALDATGVAGAFDDAGVDVRFREQEETGETAGYDPAHVDFDSDIVTDYLRGGGREREQRFSSDVEARIASSRDAVTGAAAVGVAAPEPVSTVGGAIVLGTVGAATVASQRGELDIPADDDRTELETPTDTQTSELDAPTEQQTSAGELDVPQEERIEVEVPTEQEPDEIEPTINLAEAAQKSKEEEEEEEEEAEEEEEEDDEDEDEEEEQNPFREIVGGERIVPEEMLPDEEVMIGEPEQEAQQRQQEAQEVDEDVEDELFEEPGEVVGSEQGDEQLFPSGDEPPRVEDRDDFADAAGEQPQESNVDTTFPASGARGIPERDVLGGMQDQDQATRGRSDVDVGAVEGVGVGARSRVASDTMADLSLDLQLAQSLQQATQASLAEPTVEQVQNQPVNVEETVLEEPTVAVTQPPGPQTRRPRLDVDLRPYSSGSSSSSDGPVFDKKYEGFVVEPDDLDERTDALFEGLDEFDDGVV